MYRCLPLPQLGTNGNQDHFNARGSYHSYTSSSEADFLKRYNSVLYTVLLLMLVRVDFKLLIKLLSSSQLLPCFVGKNYCTIHKIMSFKKNKRRNLTLNYAYYSVPIRHNFRALTYESQQIQ